jgi:glucan endo-1,3-alpha-glucosidase
MISYDSTWALPAVESLFNAAQGTSMKLFFSIDASATSDPTQWISIVEQYAPNANYYQYNSKPLVSTFDGGTDSFSSDSPNDGWEASFIQPLADAGIDITFLPDFDDASNYPTNVFEDFPIVDGLYGWESAWPEISDGLVSETDTIDKEVISQAHAAGKIYMMRQFTYPFIPSLQ